jgi:hypothetical protein
MLFSKYITKNEMQKEAENLPLKSFLMIDNKLSEIKNVSIWKINVDLMCKTKTSNPYFNTNVAYFLENVPEKILKKDWDKFKKDILNDFVEKFCKLQISHFDMNIYLLSTNEEIVDFFKFSNIFEHLNKINGEEPDNETIDIDFEEM